MMASGVSSIQQSAQQQITQIDSEKNANLEKLNVKFAAADKAKSSFGYIGIICVSMLFGGFFLNDFLKFGYFLYKKYIANIHVSYKIEQDRLSSAEKNKCANLNKKLDELYSQQLDVRLERVHWHLLQAKHSKPVRKKDYTVA